MEYDVILVFLFSGHSFMILRFILEVLYIHNGGCRKKFRIGAGGPRFDDVKITNGDWLERSTLSKVARHAPSFNYSLPSVPEC